MQFTRVTTGMESGCLVPQSFQENALFVCVCVCVCVCVNAILMLLILQNILTFTHFTQLYNLFLYYDFSTDDKGTGLNYCDREKDVYPVN
jgi:hypothetical protein